ncbi:MAG: hypothetical protein ACYSWX_12865, partial [Planctomycetota bacterium]
EPCLVEPLMPWREAEAFEALRDAADEGDAALAPVLVYTLGSQSEHGARTSWVRNLYAAAGLHCEVCLRGLRGAAGSRLRLRAASLGTSGGLHLGC